VKGYQYISTPSANRMAVRRATPTRNAGHGFSASRTNAKALPTAKRKLG
jgi:hypothetical protein